jgi:hypothetical protein
MDRHTQDKDGFERCRALKVSQFEIISAYYLCQLFIIGLQLFFALITFFSIIGVPPGCNMTLFFFEMMLGSFCGSLVGE